MGRYTTKDLMNRKELRVGAIVRDAVIGVALLAATAMYGCPHYNVWNAGKLGEAELQRAEQNRRIAVLEAEAKLASAKLFAEAEVARAKGVAEANAIIADGLKNNDEYLRYLWIDKVAENASRQIIYVPTEANLPILESTRLNEK